MWMGNDLAMRLPTAPQAEAKGYRLTAQAQLVRSAQVQAGSKPLGVQQDAKGAAWPPRVASQLQTLLRLANLPLGSSSCPCQ